MPRAVLSKAYPSCFAYGHSFTQGLYASDEAHAWREVLWGLVAAEYPGSAATTAYAGVTGGKLGPAYASAVTDVLPANPSLLTVQFNTNDATGGGGTPATDAEFRQETADLMDLLTDAGQAARLVLWLNNVWCGWDESHPVYARAVAFNAITAEEADARGIPVVDVWTPTVGHTEYLSQPGEPSAFPPGFEGDGFHYNDAGHAAIAAVVFAAVQAAPRVRGTAAGRSVAVGRSAAAGRAAA